TRPTYTGNRGPSGRSRPRPSRRAWPPPSAVRRRPATLVDDRRWPSRSRGGRTRRAPSPGRANPPTCGRRGEEAGAFQPQPLAEPDVTLSAHPAPIIEPQGETLSPNVRTPLACLPQLGQAPEPRE